MRVSGSTRPVPSADTASPAMSSLVPAARRVLVMGASLAARGRAGRANYRSRRRLPDSVEERLDDGVRQMARVQDEIGRKVPDFRAQRNQHGLAVPPCTDL